MKRYNFTLSLTLGLLLALGSLQSCNEKVKFYDGPDAVRFRNSHGIDRTVFSFVVNPGEEGLIRVPLELIGRAAGKDRNAQVVVLEASTTAAADQYQIISATIPSESDMGELVVRVLNTPDLETTRPELRVAIVDSDDLACGPLGYLEHTLVWSSMLLEPATWMDMSHYFTAHYSTSAYRAIIESTGLEELYFYDRNGDPIYEPSLIQAHAQVAGRKFGDWIRNYNATHPTPYAHDDGDLQGQPVVPIY